MNLQPLGKWKKGVNWPDLGDHNHDPQEEPDLPDSTSSSNICAESEYSTRLKRLAKSKVSPPQKRRNENPWNFYTAKKTIKLGVHGESFTLSHLKGGAFDVVAIKTSKTCESEIKILTAIAHKNIVRIIEVFDYDVPYMVLEYVNSFNLSAIMAYNGEPTDDEKSTILKGVSIRY